MRKKNILLLILVLVLGTYLFISSKNASSTLNDWGVHSTTLTDLERYDQLTQMSLCGFKQWTPGMVWTNSITYGQDPLGTDLCVAKFAVHPGDIIQGGVRAEISRDYGISQNTDEWYSWDFFIPEDFVDNPLISTEGRTSNWQIIGQWHSLPDPTKGETHQSYTQYSPPISIQYSYIDSKDPDYKIIMQSSQVQSLIGYDESMIDTSAIILSYGIPQKSIAIKQIEKGVWNTLTFHIVWSEEEDGSVEVFLNDESLTQGAVLGKNMHNSLSHYLQIGMYRNQSIPTTNHLYYTPVLHGETREKLINH